MRKAIKLRPRDMAIHISKLRGPPKIRQVQQKCSRMKYPRKVQKHHPSEQHYKASQRRNELPPSLDATDSHIEASRTESKGDSSGWVRYEGSGEDKRGQEEPSSPFLQG